MAKRAKPGVAKRDVVHSADVGPSPTYTCCRAEHSPEAARREGTSSTYTTRMRAAWTTHLRISTPSVSGPMLR